MNQNKPSLGEQWLGMLYAYIYIQHIHYSLLMCKKFLYQMNALESRQVPPSLTLWISVHDGGSGHVHQGCGLG